MDFISHLLVGILIALLLNSSKKMACWIVGLSILPDIFEMPLYLYVGAINSRAFWIPSNGDWAGFSLSHPLQSTLWYVPHSLIVILIVLAVVLLYRLPMTGFFVYTFHILLDIPAHTNEWAMRPFWPLPYAVSGFTDMWSWPLWQIILAWAFLILLCAGVIIYRKAKSRRKKS